MIEITEQSPHSPGMKGSKISVDNVVDHFPSVLRHCWLGDRKGIWPVRNWVLVCWWWRFDWSFARVIAPVVITTSVILIKSRKETFWYRLTQVHLENGR